MYIAPHMLGYANWYSSGLTREILFFVPFMQVFLIGPVVYFYTKSLLNTDFRLSPKDFLHFLPAILYGLYSLVVFITDKLILDEFYFYADNRDKDLSNWYQVSGLVSMVIYLVLSLKFYSNYKKRVFNEVSYAETMLFQWVRNFMIAFLGILALRVLFFILNPDWGEFGRQFWYYLVIKYTTLAEAGLRVYNVFREDKPSVSEAEAMGGVVENRMPLQVEEVKSKPAVTLKPEEGKGQLDEEEISNWKEKLGRTMNEQRLYENPRLTLADVAAELSTNTKVISKVVKHITKTLLAVALACGFNSKATFNRAFKKNTGMSPKEYLGRLAKK